MSNNQRRFENKTVLVTGGNSGIGLAAAERFAAEGAQLIITGRDEKTLQEARQKIGENATAICSDVSKLGDIDNLFAEIQEKFGRLDVVFANAGIAKLSPLEQVTEELYDSLMATNTKGVFFTIQKAISLLANPGAVVINGSVATVSGAPSAFSVYAATKAAVRSFARSFSAEFVGRGIRVNIVSPGPIETPIWNRTEGLPPEAIPALQEQFAATIPLKRAGTPAEVAAAVLFLAAEESSYIVGSELFVDGGITQI